MIRFLSAGALAVIGAAIVTTAAVPARAQFHERTVWSEPQGPRYLYEPRGSRARTRITVRNRNFLDIGTGANPGQREELDYAFPPGGPTSIGYSVWNQLDPRGGTLRQPLPGHFDLPGF